MGYYIQTPAPTDKAVQIAKLYGGQIITKPAKFSDVPAGKALIVVLHNGPFDAAGFAYSDAEFQSFTDSRDQRDKDFVLIDREKACELTGFRERA